MQDEPHVVGVFSWPERSTPDRRADALVRTLSMDRRDANLASNRSGPMILGVFEAMIAKKAVSALLGAGVHTSAAPVAAFATLSEPFRAKRLDPADGATESPLGPMYFVEPWRGESVGLVASKIIAIIRARVRLDAPRGGGLTDTSGSSVKMKRSIPGMPGVRVSIDLDTGDTPMPRSARYTEIVDLHTRDGDWIRCDGRKFNFDFLGAQRGYSDNVNMDKLAVHLAEQAPAALVDTSFKDLVVPPGCLERAHLAAAGTPYRKGDQESVFAFYSAWIGLTARHAAGA